MRDWRETCSTFYDQTGKLYQRDDEPMVWRISVYALLRRDDHLLMVKTVWNDTWQLPGGGVEPEESLAEGLIRECLEETRCAVRTIAAAPISFCEQKFYFRDTHEFCHSVLMVFPCELISLPTNGVLVGEDPTEIARVAWVPIVDLNERTCLPIFWSMIKDHI